GNTSSGKGAGFPDDPQEGRKVRKERPSVCSNSARLPPRRAQSVTSSPSATPGRSTRLTLEATGSSASTTWSRCFVPAESLSLSTRTCRLWKHFADSACHIPAPPGLQVTTRPPLRHVG